MGYFILICITFPDGYDRPMRFYFEAQWVPLSIIMATPFVVWLMKSNKLGWILIMIFAVRLGYIFNAYSYFENRLDNLKVVVSYLQTKNCNKALIIENSKKSNSYFIMSWGIPVESMMLSSLEGDTIMTTFKISDENKEMLQATDLFYSSFGTESIKALNNQYFRLDTTQKYQVIEGLDAVLKQ
jgi:hypothetical protein